MNSSFWISASNADWIFSRIREADVAPDGVGTVSQSRYIAETGGCELEIQIQVPALLLNQARQARRKELGEMREVGNREVVCGRVAGDRTSPNGHHQGAKRLHAGVIHIFRPKGSQHVAGVCKQPARRRFPVRSALCPPWDGRPGITARQRKFPPPARRFAAWCCRGQ